MPLAFESKSHATVAFGFFQIESDMLLLQDLFFFADRFCAAVLQVARAAESVATAKIEGWRITDRAAVGNLHGAIARVDLSGFIGATYAKWPFPATSEGFKQSPEGAQTQQLVAQLIEPWGTAETFELLWNRAKKTFALAEYVFAEDEFPRLVAYVDQGGYPRYKDEIRPGYVEQMMNRLQKLDSPLFPFSARTAG